MPPLLPQKMNGPRLHGGSSASGASVVSWVEHPVASRVGVEVAGEIESKASAPATTTAPAITPPFSVLRAVEEGRGSCGVFCEEEAIEDITLPRPFTLSASFLTIRRDRQSGAISRARA